MSELLIPLLNKVLNSSGQRLRKQNEYLYWSPFVNHHKPKLQVNIQTGKWHCWVSNQGGHNFFQLLKQVGASRDHYKELNEIMGSSYSVSNKKEDKPTIVTLPKEYKPLYIEDGSIQQLHALKFLMERGLSEYDILKYNIGYCVSGLYQNRIIIPSYDSNGQLNYFVGRDFYKGGMKYKNPPISKDIVGFDLYINWNEPLILCEGVFDAISIKRNAIPLFGKTISKKLSTKIIEKKTKHIVIALDNDAFHQSIEMISKFLDMGVEVNFVKLQDNQDPGELGYIKMSEKINNSEAIGFKELMRMKIYGT